MKNHRDEEVTEIEKSKECVYAIKVIKFVS